MAPIQSVALTGFPEISDGYYISLRPENVKRRRQAFFIL